MTQPQEQRRVLDITSLIRALMALQVAISKLVVELIKKEHEEGPIQVPVVIADEECGPSPTVDENCGPAKTIDENCGPAQPANEECQLTYLDEDCSAQPPVPEICDRRSIERLCDRLDEISRYLRVICRIVRS